MFRVCSRLLNDTVVCVEDNEITPLFDAEVVYTRSELIRLDGQDAESIKSAHLLKKTFGGRYVGRSDE